MAFSRQPFSASTFLEFFCSTSVAFPFVCVLIINGGGAQKYREMGLMSFVIWVDFQVFSHPTRARLFRVPSSSRFSACLCKDSGFHAHNCSIFISFFIKFVHQEYFALRLLRRGGPSSGMCVHRYKIDVVSAYVVYPLGRHQASPLVAL